MKPFFQHIKTATAMLVVSLSASLPLVAHSAVTAIPPGANFSESGSIELPTGAVQSIWLDFYTGIHVAPVTTAKLRVALAKSGFQFAANEVDSKASITVGGYARIRNEAGSYDTGKVFLGEILEQNTMMAEQSATSVGKRPVHLDAGVMQQASRAVTASGYSGNTLAAGAGVALLSDWLGDVSGLRGLINGAFAKALGAKGNRPLLCFGSCKRTTHEVVLDLSVWRGKEFKTYTLTVSKQADDIEDDLIPPLTESALSLLLEKLSAASKS